MKPTSVAQDLSKFPSMCGDATATLSDFGELTDQTLLRIAELHGLTFYQQLALLLKNDCEAHLREAGGGAGAGYAGQSGADVIRYKPDAGRLFEVMEQAGRRAAEAGYDRPAFQALCKQMALARLHELAIDSAELAAFARQQEATRGLFKGQAAEKIAAFRRKQAFWLLLLDRHGDDLLVLERERLQAAEIRRHWLQAFGGAYVAMQEQTERLKSAIRRLRNLAANPGITAETLEQLVVAAEAEAQQRLRGLQIEAQLAPYLAQPSGGTAMTGDDVSRHRILVKRLLREIWMLLHPDRLSQHPRFGDLTDDQRALLASLWHRAMEVRSAELGFAPNQLGAHFRSIEVLEDILASAKDTLAIAGLDMDADLVIRGETLDEQIAWLDNAQRRIEAESLNAKAELIALWNDPSLMRWDTALHLSDGERHAYRQQMHRRAEKYATKADDLQRALRAELAGNWGQVEVDSAGDRQ